MVKDLIKALSLANLCFVIAWDDLLNSPIRRFNTCLAIILNVILLSTVFWVGITLVRRSGNLLAMRIARLVFPLIVLLPLNSIIKIMLPKIMPLNAIITLGLAVGVMGLYEIMPWYHYIIRTANIIVIVMFPFFIISMSQATWSLINSPRNPTIPAVTTNERPNRRVLWLVFDEMDQHVAFSNRPKTLNLPELDRLHSQAIYATNAYPPADSTLVSLPALITGQLLSNTELINQSTLMITYADSGKSVNWSSQPNLFSKAREAGFNTTLIGWYLPYCSMIGQNLTSCSWMDTEAETLRESMSEQIQDLICTVPVASRFVIANSLKVKNREERKKTLESYIKTLAAAKKAVTDPNFGLILVHWPVPHPPGIYNRHSDKYEIDGESSYFDNLQLVDNALGELRQVMEDAGTWNDSIILLTSDHWWRTDIWRPTDFWTSEETEVVKDKSDHRIPFLLKLAGQKQTVTYEPVFNNILTHDLILALLGGELSSPDDVSHWLDQHRTIGESPYRFNLPK